MSRIALDAMGGDRAPAEIVAGAVDAVSAGLDVVLVGDESRLGPLVAESGVEIPVVHAPSVIDMHEDPAQAIRSKRDASITVAARLVADGEAQGLVSAGSTGAVLAAAAFVIGRIRGVARPAIGSVYPTGQIVLDSGANLECRPEHLVQFGAMGAALASVYLDLESPRVGLLNIGEEPGKGRELEKEAFTLLDKSPLHFIGNVEGRDLGKHTVDVVVTDGFTGNVLLKGAEGTASMLVSMISSLLAERPDLADAVADLAPTFTELRERIDPETYGGAHLVGSRGVVVVAHGSSSRIAIANALAMAAEGADRGLVGAVTKEIEAIP
ncbi:MAG: phosphate acyltransferase PlsX [Acidimicrobiia bacterium]|nr:phosphate acyltransferase PlsX [Acidimicrobiia bacterium]